MFIQELHNLKYSQTQSIPLSPPISISETSQFTITKNQIEIQDNKITKKLIINIDDIKFMTWIKHEDIYEVTFQYKQNILDKFFFDIYNGTLGRQALIKRIAQDNFTDNYERLETIKRILNGEIVKCRRRDNNEVFVAKIQQNNHFLIERELQINLHLAENPHQNVASMVEYYFENDQIILIYPYFSGGTLNQLVNSYASDLSKLKAKSIMKKILSGLNHIHNLGIIHRDIKMDNIMIEEIDDHKCVKIIDFGFSAFKDNQHYLSEKCGTIGYFAPEVINGQFYNEKCDIYSLAQVFHMLLTGNPMFDRNMSRQQIIRLSKNNLFAIDYRNIKESKAQQLIYKMLGFQEKRYDAQQCLEHSYFFKTKSLESKINNLETLKFKSPF